MRAGSRITGRGSTRPVITVEQAYRARIEAVEAVEEKPDPPLAPPAPPRPLRPRPPVQPEPGILGFSRYTRGRLGSRLLTLFFVFVFGLIVVQLIVTLLRV